MVMYQLKPSLALLCINFSLYLLAAVTLLIYFQNGLTSLMLFSLTILLSMHDLLHYRQKTEQTPEKLSLNLRSGSIDWRFNDDYRQFSEYSVYTCRWGMILVLKQPKFRQHLILLADRFKNIHEYLDLRYQLIRLNQDIHAS